MKKITIFIWLVVSMLSCKKENSSVSEPTTPVPNGNFKVYNFTVDSRLGKPLNTEITVENGDFVFVEVLGQITLGLLAGNSYGDGILGYTQYNKYNFQHGSLVTLLDTKQFETKQLNTVNHPIYFQMLDNTKLVGGGFGYLPHCYFFAPISGKISFDINDKDYTNNSGSFLVNVYILNSKSDIERNTFNRCPQKEPQTGKDCEGESWVSEGVKAWFYHGIFNAAYRGTSKNKGCQCVYDNGTLVTSHEDQGTFDYGFWEFEGNVADAKAKHLHLILDVIPHDAWKEIDGNSNKVKMYNNPTIFCK